MALDKKIPDFQKLKKIQYPSDKDELQFYAKSQQKIQQVNEKRRRGLRRRLGGFLPKKGPSERQLAEKLINNRKNDTDFRRLEGYKGEAETDLQFRGTVRILGRSYPAFATKEWIRKGQSIRVEKVEMNELHVTLDEENVFSAYQDEQNFRTHWRKMIDFLRKEREKAEKPGKAAENG